MGVMDQLPTPVLVGNDMGHSHCNIAPAGPQGRVTAALEAMHHKPLGKVITDNIATNLTSQSNEFQTTNFRDTLATVRTLEAIRERVGK